MLPSLRDTNPTPCLYQVPLHPPPLHTTLCYRRVEGGPDRGMDPEERLDKGLPTRGDKDSLRRPLQGATKTEQPCIHNVHLMETRGLELSRECLEAIDGLRVNLQAHESYETAKTFRDAGRQTIENLHRQMAPKQAATRSTQVTTTPSLTTTTTTSVTNAQLQAMIDQGVTAALAARDANRNGDDIYTSGTGGRRTERVAREDNQHFQELALMCVRMFPEESDKIERYKCLADENLVIPLEEIQLDDKLHFIEEPVEIMDSEVKQLKQSRIPIVKVRWNSWRGPKFTWEREDFFMKKYPHLFPGKKRGCGDNRAPGHRSRKDMRM
ncbi:hypothetical protein Tco_0441417 [Tanacetum coccineum]